MWTNCSSDRLNDEFGCVNYPFKATLYRTARHRYLRTGRNMLNSPASKSTVDNLGGTYFAYSYVERALLFIVVLSPRHERQKMRSLLGFVGVTLLSASRRNCCSCKARLRIFLSTYSRYVCYMHSMLRGAPPVFALPNRSIKRNIRSMYIWAVFA